jgi:hypothetical protein
VTIARVGTLLLGCLLWGCSATPPTAPDAVPTAPGTPPPAGSAVQGRFSGVGHRAEGGVRFTAENGRARLEFLSDFSVAEVPGPFVYLNTTNNANTGTPLRVSALRTNSGAQQYDFEVPAGVRYTWVLVWCDPFNTPVAEAAIPATP